MDAFYAAIEQRDRAELRGRPVIVGGMGRRGVVATASYEAREFGVHSAMPGAQARRLCPGGIFVPPRMKVYVAVAAEIRSLFEEYTPLVEPLSLDEAFLEVSGSRLLFGSGEQIARELRRRVTERTGLTVSVGVASCKFVAKVASDLEKPDALVVVPPGDEESFLAPLPVKRLWGAGAKTQERFASLGLRTIGDVQKLSRDELVALFGEATGAHYFEISHGIDARSVNPDREIKSLSHEITFDRDLVQGEACLRVLLELSEKVGRRLRRHGLSGHTIRLKLRFPPFTTLTRQCKEKTATHDDLVIYRRAGELFQKARPAGRPVRLLGVGVSELVPAEVSRQGGLFEESGRKSERVLGALDEIRDKFGDGAIGHGKGG